MDNITLQQEIKRRMRVQGLSLLEAKLSLIESVNLAAHEVRDDLIEEYGRVWDQIQAEEGR